MNSAGLHLPLFSSNEELQQALGGIIRANLFPHGLKRDGHRLDFRLEGPLLVKDWLGMQVSCDDSGGAWQPLVKIPGHTVRGTFWLDGQERVIPVQLLSQPSEPLRAYSGRDVWSYTLARSCTTVTAYFERNPLTGKEKWESFLLPSLRQILTKTWHRALAQRSQVLDRVNPVAELAHQRQARFRVRGPVARDGIAEREVLGTNRGKICPIETPESVYMGLQVHLAWGARPAQGGWTHCDSGSWLGSSAALIPFLEHNDPNRAMMGAKYLKQALPLLQPEPPWVATGLEGAVVEAQELLLKSPRDGQLLKAGAQALSLGYADGSRQNWKLLECGQQPGSGRWLRLAGEVAQVGLRPGLVKECHDDWVLLDGGEIIRGKPGWMSMVQPGQQLAVGDPLFCRPEILAGQVLAAHACTQAGELALGVNALTGFMPWYGYNFEDALVISQALAERLSHFRVDEQGLTVVPLELGDKLAGRHGNKGVVARILPCEEMPRLDDGRPLELLVNPHSLLSRMNLGLLYEAHWGWLAQQAGQSMAFPPFQGGGWERLRAAGPAFQQRVSWNDPSHGRLCQTDIVVGFTYVLKLNHCARAKLAVRTQGARSRVTGQPLRGGPRGGGQRLGEMESWALLAHQADENLKEFLHPKSDLKAEESFRVFCEVLKALGYQPVWQDHHLGLEMVERPAEDLPEVREASLVEELYVCACGLRAYAGEWLKGGGSHGPRKCPQCGSRAVDKTLAWHRQGLMGRCLFGEKEDQERHQAAQILLDPPVAHPLDAQRSLSALYVLPPALRPYRADRPGLTHLYQEVLAAKPAKRSASVERLFQHLKEMLKGKTGLLRGSLLGRRVDDSGRAVIVPHPELALGSCQLPPEMLERFEAGPVLLNRAPTLHRYNLLGFEVAGASAGPVLSLHPLSCGGFAADFDGDTMAVHLPRSEPAKAEARQKLAFEKHTRSVAHGQNFWHVEQDLVSGGYLLGHGNNRQELRDRLSLRGGWDDWMRQSFAAATHHGMSFSVADIMALEIRPDFAALASQGHSLAVMVASGARGNADLFERIRRDLAPGWTADAYWTDCQRARREMLPKKLGTPKGGDLTRRMVYGLLDVTASQGDCGAHSVLSCLHRDQGKICQGCYGLDPSTELAPEPGLPIGILAAQSIGERATQDFMKVFQGHGAETVSLIEEARSFMLWGKKPAAVEDGVEWLYAKVYEKKVARVHFEVVVAMMGERGLDARARSRPSWLTRAAYANASGVLQQAARQGELEDFSSSIARIARGLWHG